jgi:hypothetical protein
VLTVDNLQPQIKQAAIDGTRGDQMQPFENTKPRRQPDRERRKDDVKRDCECKLQSREKQGGQNHCAAPLIIECPA